MGLVDYDSDSGGSSDGEALRAPTIAKPAAADAATGKKPFQKLVDRANQGKILVNLPSATASSAEYDIDGKTSDRPAKRVKVAGAGGGSSRFSGFGSFLPPPKKTTALSTAAGNSKAASSSSPTSSLLSSSAKNVPPRPGINLKTSSEAAFSRRTADDYDGGEGSLETDHSGAASSSRPPNVSSKGLSLSLPPPKASAAPSIPQGQKAAEDVRLVGNPLMFMPLSVSRKPKKKTGSVPPKAAPAGGGGIPAAVGAGTSQKRAATDDSGPAAAPAKKKISLFSLGGSADDNAGGESESAEYGEDDAGPGNGAYEPLFQTETHSDDQTPADTYYEQHQQPPPPQAQAQASSLDAVADDLQLSAKQRRALFGRRGTAGSTAQLAATFDMDREYRHNEALRQEADAAAAGGQPPQQSHNAVRTLMPGKHSLRQLVNQVHTQRDALEETFAKNRASQRESGGKYGWR